MFNKLYDLIKKFFLKNFHFIIILLLFTIELPYTIDAPGGYINVTNRIDIEDSYESDGSFNMAYVSEIKATIPTLIYALLNPNWDITKNSDILLENETIENIFLRNKLALEEANNNAIITAYTKAGYDYTINSQKLYVAYIYPEAESDLEVGDLIVEIDNIKIENKNQITEIIESKQTDDEITFKVVNNNQEYERTAKVKNIDDMEIIGIIIYEILQLDTNPEIDIKTSSSESGPSGGLMTALAIYDSLVYEDITGGNTIVGTGTIDSLGNVGSIGGVKYKLIGAIKNNAKLFIVPNGENYDEVIELKEKYDYDIEIIGVSTFDEALEFLKEYNS